MDTDCECIVIGAGVVGLAIAAKLAAAGRDVLVLEGEAHFGTITSARNSEVIHAGIYYPAGSLKARLCVEGRDALYRYCADHQIEHAQCGKLIVATSTSQLEQLESIQQRALVNGVSDIRLLAAEEAMSMEPQLKCLGALHSPSTGIIDTHGLMLSLLGEGERFGAALATHSPVASMSHDVASGVYTVNVVGENAMSLTTRHVINAAGHGACALAAPLLASTSQAKVTPVLSKGNYFRLSGKAPFSRLIYPVPEQGGLGVHITIDLGGQARFGPDVEPVNEENYSVDPARSAGFYAAVREYWPGLPDDSLAPDYAGIRPKIEVDGELYTDFMIQSPADHGMPGLINLFGVESPGLTACLAIADDVHRLMPD
ncbi:NAD(P)/FAD-dependent oxidoreductase [Granulosicoccus antarcticus]|uniref:L-2-hydroxyglutarate oxidase LhgO n=1 Tax=Granulosicoccus antarcticus IMCC3135 TaxID=1192854 RepID=A0A2Z2NLQ1_9GAMM|nr:NAD(P)/FAD-dependent oxidoreductase [Granulosicoccus antarcticus]ASJ71475.1 L-2-hydroxyglutarate oxidase LhgO [Granulosicoccus antarcticus IMCC3135]